MNKLRVLYIAIISLLLNSCFADDINRDSNSPYEATPGALFSYAQKSISDYMNTPNYKENIFRLLMQYWQESQYVEESNYDFANRDVSNNIWKEAYTHVLNNLEKAKTILEKTTHFSPDWPEKKKAQLATIELMQVYTFQTLVDTFGDIPYSQALNINNLLLKYDRGEDIYKDLIIRAEKAVADLSGLSITKSFDVGDLFYNGEINKWLIFGNSLLLKLAIGIADYDNTLAKQTASNAMSRGVMTSANDNCQLPYMKNSPNYNPLYANLVVSERTDFIAGKTLVDFMKANLPDQDPRIPKYYKPAKEGKYENKHVGQVIGEGGNYKEFSNIGDFASTPDTPGTILSYTEVAFYKAEAAARWNIGTVEAEYENAIKASMKEWGVSDADASNYISKNPYKNAPWKKYIGEQAWVAMYNQGLTSWNFYRRLDYPKLSPATNAIGAAEGKVPVRLQYAPKEQSVNGSNWTAASNAIGGDKLTTRIFWDKY